MKRIKNQKLKIVNLLVVMCLLMACGEVEKGQYAIDKVPPGQVSDVDVENLPGGAILTYTLPDDDDLLYVKVVYRMSDGRQVEQKSSAYTTRIAVEGLGRAQKQTVHLICGDHSGNESAPYPVEIDPLDAPIYDLYESIQMTEDYGGFLLRWDNPLRANVVLTIYALDENNRWAEVENVYSSAIAGRYNVRGFPPEEVTFAVSVRDRWENKTNIIRDTFIPLFEEKLDRLKFVRWNPPGIPYDDLAGAGGYWSVERLWDGLFTDPQFSFSLSAVLPKSLTFNMGQMAKLNRIKVYQRMTANQVFIGTNVKRFRLYGSPSPNVNDDFDTWIFLGDFTSVKPSGSPLGTVTEEDIAYAAAGEDYTIQENRDVAVQYIRIHIMSTHGGGMGVAQFSELEFFGNIVIDND